MVSINHPPLPDAQSAAIRLAHPTEKEEQAICEATANTWKDALSVDAYTEETAYLKTAPLAKNGGVTQWILVDKNQPPDERLLLASCETFIKRSWVSDAYGNLKDTITHGVASVFTQSELRGRGYAARLMTELAAKLPSWQTETVECAASVLFSDIGRVFYSRLGWRTFPSQELTFRPAGGIVSGADQVLARDLEGLCKLDEILSRRALVTPSTGGKIRFMVVPDLDHMLWHHSKENFACQKIFNREPVVKGAVSGQEGRRVWVIWTRRFYEPPSATASMNTLYILRLVIENEGSWDTESQVKALRAVILAAQSEAAQWGLHSVKLWGPSEYVLDLVKQTGIDYRHECRVNEGIPSLRSYMGGSGAEEEVEWVGNEKYGWC